MMQRRAAVQRPGIGLRPMRQQQLDHEGLPGPTGQVQRGFARGIGRVRRFA